MMKSLTRIAPILGACGEIHERFIDGGIGHNFSTMGDVLGYEDYEAEDFATVGVAPKLMSPAQFAAARGRVPAPQFRRPMVPSMGPGGMPAQSIVVGPRPAWRNQLAPGVPYPGERLQPLPLTPSANGGVFTAAVQTINFTARPQTPFKGERLLVTVRRTGAAGVTIQATSFLVGTKLQQVQQGNFDLEVYAPTAFGVRYSLDACEPGVDIVLSASAIPAVTGTDTVAVVIQIIGRSMQ